VLGGGRREGVSVMKDKELKLIEVEESHTLRRFCVCSTFLFLLAFFLPQKYHSLASRVTCSRFLSLSLVDAPPTAAFFHA
jgi:hypothetical protein